jgi:hypothetical protein
MPDYIKHLVECKCILPQFKDRQQPLYHSFVVFSVIEDNGDVQVSFAQCPNCDIIHKVTEIGVSIIIRKEEMSSLITVDEIKSSLPESLSKLLSSYDLFLHSWQEISFILEHELWGQRPVILSKEEVEGVTMGKYLAILGKELFQIKTFSREEYVK